MCQVFGEQNLDLWSTLSCQTGPQVNQTMPQGQTVLRSLNFQGKYVGGKKVPLIPINLLYTSRYKWEAVNCNDGSIYSMCTVRMPNCPQGYTWLFNFGMSCFKTYGPLTASIGSTSVAADHPVANTMCSQDMTRLAVAETQLESTSLFAWLSKIYQSPSLVINKIKYPKLYTK